MNVVDMYLESKKLYLVEILLLNGNKKYEKIIALNAEMAIESSKQVYFNFISAKAYLINEAGILTRFLCKHNNSKVLKTQFIDTGMRKMHDCICLECGKEYTAF